MTPEDLEGFKGKSIVGLTEKIILKGQKGQKELIARIDTGATKSSIDLSLATRLELGPVVDSKIVKSAHGEKLRPVVRAEVLIAGKAIEAKFTLADRNKMKYQVLIGQNILKKGFLVDPNVRFDAPTLKKEEKK